MMMCKTYIPMSINQKNYNKIMILAIDIGNSHSVFALCDNNNILCRFRIATDTKITSDALAVWLSGVLKLHDFDISVITHVIVCSVVPAFDNAISSMSVTYLQQPAYFLKSDDLNITVSLVSIGW